MATTLEEGILTTVSFLTGAITSMVGAKLLRWIPNHMHKKYISSPTPYNEKVAGYIGMQVAVFSNARTTKAAAQNYGDEQYKAAFNVAFRAGDCV